MDPIVAEVLKQAPAVAILCFSIWRVYTDMMEIVRDNQKEIAVLRAQVDTLIEQVAKLQAK